MLNSAERRRLADLEELAERQDPRFAEGLRRGRARAPRELRWYRTQTATLALAPPFAAAGLWAAMYGQPLGEPVAGLALVALAVALRGWLRRTGRLCGRRPALPTVRRDDPAPPPPEPG